MLNDGLIGEYLSAQHSAMARQFTDFFVAEC
jgi:hypothetical protein